MSRFHSRRCPNCSTVFRGCFTRRSERRHRRLHAVSRVRRVVELNRDSRNERVPVIPVVPVVPVVPVAPVQDMVIAVRVPFRELAAVAWWAAHQTPLPSAETLSAYLESHYDWATPPVAEDLAVAFGLLPVRPIHHVHPWDPTVDMPPSDDSEDEWFVAEDWVDQSPPSSLSPGPPSEDDTRSLSPETDAEDPLEEDVISISDEEI